ncbi:MAG: DUF6266 family protein [Lentimicrobiaceae bacterium]
MAVRKQNGEYTGLVGNVSIYEMFGKSVMRTRPATPKKISPKFKESQNQFAYVMHLMQHFKNYINPGFQFVAENRSAYHTALSVNLNKYNEALRLEQTGDLQWMQLSSGKLSGAETVVASKSGDQNIHISWQGTEQGRSCNDTDHVMVLAYNSASQACYINLHQTIRSDGQCIIEIPDTHENDPVDVWISFHAPIFEKKNIQSISNSHWAGRILW